VSTEPETTRMIRSWLDEGVTELPDRVLDAVLDELPATPQSRRRGIGGWFRSSSFAVATAAFAAAVAVTFAIYALAPAGEVRLGWAPDGPADAIADPTPYPVLPLDWSVPLAPGRWAVPAGFDVPLTLEVGPGWYSCWYGEQEVGVCLGGEGEIDPAGVGFTIIDYVVADPCDATGGGPPLPADVDDIAAAISGLAGFEVTEPLPVSVDGVPGLRLTVTAPMQDSCRSLRTWATAERVNGVGAGETNEVTVLVVEGKPLLIAAAYQVSASASEVAQLRSLVQSVRFEP